MLAKARMTQVAVATRNTCRLRPPLVTGGENPMIYSSISSYGVFSPCILRGSRWRVRSGDLYGEQWYTPEDQYLVVGLAHCFEKNDDGKLVDRLVIEPISANSLEAMSHGAKTSYIHVYSLLLADALKMEQGLPPEFENGMFCEKYESRCDAAARTWMRPHAVDNLMDIVPLGMIKSSFNYDTSDMRVLNMENVVNDTDNIKQDMSIDVYGRKQNEKETVEKDEGDIDSLLAA